MKKQMQYFLAAALVAVLMSIPSESALAYDYPIYNFTGANATVTLLINFPVTEVRTFTNVAPTSGPASVVTDIAAGDEVWGVSITQGGVKCDYLAGFCDFTSCGSLFYVCAETTTGLVFLD